MKRYSLFISLSIVFMAIIFVVNGASALEPQVIRFDAATIERGYTIHYNQTTHPEWGDFLVGIYPNLVNEPITVETKPFDDNLPDPPGLKRVSDYYIYDILRVDENNDDPLILNKPFAISIKINGISNYYRKRVYYWGGDRETGSWIALPSSADYDNGYIRAFTHLPFSRIAVFEDSQAIDNYGIEGKATFLSWPSQPYGVASNDYPIGTKLRVRNVDNGKIVDVTVQSTGPFAPFNQRKVIDLSRNAFSKIEDTWKGLARVQVWPIGDGVKVLGVDTYSFDENSTNHSAPTAAVPEPHPGSTAVIAINEANNEILYSKNYDTVLPIASITKLMTASVFLDTNTPFDKVVEYSAEDNTFGSKLYVNPGETMLVKDLYYSMLVGSANNAANALARVSGLSRDEYVRKMNEKAQSWGLSHTKFTDVSGLDTGNVSTVYEVALMSKHILKDFRVLQGTTTREYLFKTINTDQPHTIKSSAKGVIDGIVDSSLFITGMKTGYLDEAGYCFMLKAAKDRNSGYVITVVLGAESASQRYNETNDLMGYGLSKI